MSSSSGDGRRDDAQQAVAADEAVRSRRLLTHPPRQAVFAAERPDRQAHDRAKGCTVLNLRFYMDRETGEPHFVRHGLSEGDVRDVLFGPLEDRPGQEGARTALGRNREGRYIRVVYVPDREPDSVFVITAYEIGPKSKLALLHRLRRKP